MHRVAQRIENRRDVVGNVRMHRPDVLLRDGYVLGETPVRVDPQDIDLLANVAIASPARLADAAAYMPFRTDPLTDGRTSDSAPHGNDPADKFMPRRDPNHHP